VLSYFLRRSVDLVVAVLGVSTLVFVVLRLSGDPIALLVSDTTTQEEIDRLRQQLGFNDPLPVQYARFLGAALTGDFGSSLRYFKPALQVVLESLPATLELTFAALTLATAVGLVAGTLSAVWRDSWLDAILSVAVLVGQSMPFFWLAILLILLFSVELRWLPTSGRGELSQLVMPALTLAAYSTARTTRLVRAGLIEVLAQDYIRTARAKGLVERTVLLRHALRNVAIPVVTVVGLEFGTLLGGAVVTETIFAWPGVGRLVVQAIQGRDYPIVQAAVFYTAILFVLINLVVDFVYTRLDPRVSVG
jgi:ABC-type dipeptide/oligopeptide/nickel transport system permease component